MTKTNLVIALDYDHTYTADKTLWAAFLNICRLAGHKVVVVTARDDRFDKTPCLNTLSVVGSVYYTRGVAKRWWMEQFAAPEHQKIDIWIDDKPEAILQNSTMSKEALNAWRAERTE